MRLKDYPGLYRIYLVKVDMRLLSHFADYILENSADSYSPLSLNIKMALKIALILCYSRPFLENNNEHNEGEESIEDKLIKDFNDEERVIHRNILEMRNKEIGISDASVQDIQSFESNIVHISMHRNDSIPLEYACVGSIKKMADKISAAADELADIALEVDVGLIMKPADEV